MHKSTLTLKIIDFKMVDEKSSVSYKMNVNVKFLSYSAIKVMSFEQHTENYFPKLSFRTTFHMLF
jgi:hypothetical protein